MSLTPQYGWDIPDVGADENTWGGLIRTLWTDLDAQLHGSTTVLKATFAAADVTDDTKTMRWDLSGITTGTNRSFTWPNYDGTLATVAGTETFTNKTLTTPTVSLPTTMTGATNDWAFALDGDDLVIQYNGVDVFKLTTAGAIIAKDDITAFGTP